MAVHSKHIKLSHKASSASDYTDLTNLQSIPTLGGSADSLEITTLDDDAHVYTNGLLNYGDNLAFVFLYETTQFLALDAIDAEETWKITLPDTANTTCTFTGTSSVSLDGVGTNANLTYTLNIKPSSEMVFA